MIVAAYQKWDARSLGIRKNRLIQPRLTMGFRLHSPDCRALLYMVQPFARGKCRKICVGDRAAQAREIYRKNAPGQRCDLRDGADSRRASYMMGSPAGEKGRKEDEGPQHPVKVRPFWMGKLEVTWDEYERLLAEQKHSNRRPLQADGEPKPIPTPSPTPDHPLTATKKRVASAVTASPLCKSPSTRRWSIATGCR